MNMERVQQIIATGENTSIEFKECKTAFNKDVYETVCAFLNRAGGEILLGINNNGDVVGIEPEKIDQIQKEFVAAILYIYVPPSSQVHRVNNQIFDRNYDADIDITDNTTLASQLYIRKQNTYTENRVYPFVTLEHHLRSDLIAKARRLAGVFNDNHPWLNLTDMELLQSMQLYQHDVVNNQSGFTLAAILLFGNDSTILSVLPHHKTDAILRRVNLDRYDDRDTVKANLIESYERLMTFIAKHLPDPFYQDEVANRISLRDKIFREVVANILIHREYSNPYPAKIIIERNQVIAKNSNRPHFHGVINPANFSPFPKNLIISAFFREIGRAEELGSGVRNLFHYTKAYSDGVEPQLIEEDVFKIVVPLDERLMLDNEQATPQANENYSLMILDYCKIPRTRSEIQLFVDIADRKYFRESILKPLLESGKILQTIPDKPTSPKQKYYTNLNN